MEIFFPTIPSITEYDWAWRVLFRYCESYMDERGWCNRERSTAHNFFTHETQWSYTVTL